MTDSNAVSHWIEQVKSGDSHAANLIWHHYFDRLVRAVRGRMQGQNRAARDEEDVVLSVFDSFYDAAEQGRFPDLSDRDDLWHLLLRMSARKVIDKRRRDQRQRRGGGQPIFSIDDTIENDGPVIDIIGHEPSPDMVVMMQESIERFFDHLGEKPSGENSSAVGQLRDLAGAKLEGFSNAELAERFGCSERTIERRLHLIREKYRQMMDNKHEHSPKETPRCDSGTD